MIMDTVIEVKNFSFRYADGEKKALDDVSFSVMQGEFLCVIGSNGSGKSSLCNALTGLIPSYFAGKMEGSITIMGDNTASTSVAQLSKRIGLVFQNPFNQLSYTTSTVEEELAFGLCNMGVPREEMTPRIWEIAKTIRVEQLLHKNPLELSGGQLQRVAIGSALILNPSILVLDECTTQLDPLGSEEVFDVVKQLNSQGVTVIMADHDMERVARCADRVLAMEGGRVLAIDTPGMVFGDDGLLKHGVDRPDYAKLGIALSDNGMYFGSVLLTEQEAILAGEGALVSG